MGNIENYILNLIDFATNNSTVVRRKAKIATQQRNGDYG